ncbi:MAG: DUF418 domain-containing protein [Chitinophagaceae bacterium]
MSLATTPPSATVTPVRIPSLDIIRGLAVLGILVISIQEFGGFSVAEQNFYRVGTHGGNYKLLTLISVLFEGKMRALFALVFGAGIILFMQKKHPVPISGADAYIRRQFWLIIFGVVNAFIFLWPGDILFHYGVLGILLFAFWRLSPRALFIAGLVCTLVFCGKQYWNYSDDKKDYKKYLAVTSLEKKFKADSLTRARKDSSDRTMDTILLKDTLRKNKLADSLAKKNDTLTKKQAGEKGKWEGIVKGLKYDSASAKAEKKAMRNHHYGKIWDHLLERSQQRESSWLYRIGIWDIGGMMFLGMALLGMGFFHRKWAGSKYLIIALVCIAIGFLLAWWRIQQNNTRLIDYAKFVEKHSLPYDLFFPIERLLLAIGYASLVLGLLKASVFKWIWQGFAAIGRMAFTNYILQTLVCTFIFYGYGLGYFGRLQQWELYFIVIEIAIVQLIFSVLWQRYYNLGPVEWLWRSLVYRKWLPNKKKTESTV